MTVALSSRKTKLLKNIRETKSHFNYPGYNPSCNDSKDGPLGLDPEGKATRVTTAAVRHRTELSLGGT